MHADAANPHLYLQEELQSEWSKNNSNLLSMLIVFSCSNVDVLGTLQIYVNWNNKPHTDEGAGLNQEYLGGWPLLLYSPQNLAYYPLEAGFQRC